LRQRSWRGASVLLVRGTRGRDWLAARLVEAGAQVDEVAAYRRETPALDPAATADLLEALARPDEHLWLFSSSEAIDRLAEQAAPRAADAATWGSARALATHPRIAQRARDAGFGVVLEARPTPAAVVACIQSIRP
jgi:uroporphyrinogen-III synthase